MLYFSIGLWSEITYFKALQPLIFLDEKIKKSDFFIVVIATKKAAYDRQL